MEEQKKPDPPQHPEFKMPTVDDIRAQEMMDNCAVRSILSLVGGMGISRLPLFFFSSPTLSGSAQNASAFFFLSASSYLGIKNYIFPHGTCTCRNGGV
jgi:hypothetical protein